MSKGANWDTPLLSSPDAAKSETVATIVVTLRVDKGAIEVQVVRTQPGVCCTRPVAAVRPLMVQRACIVVVASVDKIKRRLSELSRTSRVICNVVGGEKLSPYGLLRPLEWLHQRTHRKWPLVVYHCWFCYLRSLLGYGSDGCLPSE